MTNHMQHTEANCGSISNDATPPESPVDSRTLQEIMPEIFSVDGHLDVYAVVNRAERINKKNGARK